LSADVKEHGVRVPIDVDEEGNILDGHHRYKIDHDCPRRVIKGLTEGEKRAFVFRANFIRRNLSPSQKKDATAEMKKTAKMLRQEDAKKWTQAALARVFGVARNTVSDWFRGTNVGADNASTPAKASTYIEPDARVFGVDRSTVSKWFPPNGSNVNVHDTSTPAKVSTYVAPDARVFGVDQTTVSLWFCKDRSNTSARNTSTPAKASTYIEPDARVKVNPKAKPAIAAAVAAGPATRRPGSPPTANCPAQTARLARCCVVRGGMVF
jgi:DNA-binding transcriptional regulator YiaG